MESSIKRFGRVERPAGDRRVSIRFPMQREVKHQSIGIGSTPAGSGETVNMSSRGLLFKTGENLTRGEWVEVYVNWPAQLDRQINLQLVARGPVVRVEGGHVAMAIHQHEFRTASPKSASQASN
jgi:hypothetical protein